MQKNVQIFKRLALLLVNILKFLNNYFILLLLYYNIVKITFLIFQLREKIAIRLGGFFGQNIRVCLRMAWVGREFKDHLFDIYHLVLMDLVLLI